MLNKVTVLFISLLLVFNSIFIVFDANGQALAQTVTSDDIEVSQGGVLYREAASKLVNIPDNFNPEKIIKYGWKENPEMENILKDNKETIELFKKATLQENDGFAFGKKPQELNAMSKMPAYFNVVKLFKLLLLEARKYESDKQYAQASEDYLVALRLMHRIGQQKYGLLMAAIINVICIDKIYPCLRDAIKNNSFAKEDYKHILDALSLIRNDQDFLKSALDEEYETSKGTLKMIEDEARNGATFAKLFAINEEQAMKYKNQAAKLNPMTDSDFFEEFNKQADSGNRKFFDIAIAAAKDNNLEAYEKNMKEFKDSIGNTEMLYGQLYALLGSDTNPKDLKLKIADLEAKIILSIGMPQFSKMFTRYHVFYNKLNILITAFAIKLYQMENSNLPENINQLSPKYLRAVSQDTFNNFMPLDYKKEGNDFILSSVGAPELVGGEKAVYDTGAIVFSSK